MKLFLFFFFFFFSGIHSLNFLPLFFRYYHFYYVLAGNAAVCNYCARKTSNLTVTGSRWEKQKLASKINKNGGQEFSRQKGRFFFFLKSHHPIPRWDSISRPIAPVSLVAGTGPRLQVTRLGKFCLVGGCLLWAVFLITEVAKNCHSFPR
jgi:hypothetical protein